MISKVLTAAATVAIAAGLNLAVAQSAQANAVEFFKCKLAEKATMDQLVTATKAMLKDAKAKGHAEYGVYFLNPLYSTDISSGTFYWVGVGPSAGAVGAFNDYWESEANKKHRDRFGELSAGCESSSLHYGTEVKMDD